MLGMIPIKALFKLATPNQEPFKMKASLDNTTPNQHMGLQGKLLFKNQQVLKL